MWFLLSIIALIMLVSKRTTEKNILRGIDSTTMMWLQQAVALPFIILTLFASRFYLPEDLSQNFWLWMGLYAFLNSFLMYFYFEALSISNVSIIAPLLSLFAVTNIISAYFILGQVPSIAGISGASLMIVGVYILTTSKKERISSSENRAKTKAIYFALISVVLLSIVSNIEVFMLREANPTSYNFYSSVLTVLTALVVSVFVRKQSGKTQKNYSRKTLEQVVKNKLSLMIIGVTYTVNMLATYQAKLIAPNAGYVGAVKQAQVLPMVLIGVLFFKEDFSRRQAYGLVLIITGLLALATN